MTWDLEFCPFCENQIPIEHFISKEEWLLGDTIVKVDFPLYRCPICMESFFDLSASYDPFEYAYQEYEKITGQKWTGGESEVVSRKEVKI